MSFENVKKFFEDFGLGNRVNLLEQSSATVPLAAIAVGCEEKQIAKTLSFLVGDQPILIVTAGTAKIDNKKYKATFLQKPKMIPGELVEEYIGHDPGGVCPFAVRPGVAVYLDASLRQNEVVYPGAGSDNSMVELTIDELERYSFCKGWVDVCKHPLQSPAVKSLSEMTLQELWALFPIRLEQHQTYWKDWYLEEEALLKAFLPGSVRLHHIGSTAVEGIQAKPIIDILAEAPVLEHETIRNLLQDNGYLCMAQRENRLDFNKGYTPEGFAERVFHLHLRAPGDRDELFFRDYLSSHPGVAKEYESLKLSLWDASTHDRDAYTEGKTDFILRHMEKTMKVKVQYTTMIVKNLEESVRFYRDVLGFRESYHVETPGGGEITIMKSDGGASVELIENTKFDVGLYSVGTDVDNLDEAILRLKEHGYETTGPVIPTSVGRMTFVLDPSGVRICLIEHTKEYKEKYM
jgi:prolyl-tRNA editing enzyme YbaK/EbsC (Cys-tRNA(Pro) deacylase)/GrpB-like predicted nucleotidyltransferase (UPF0157 family)/catechol 2,3-dioxygenase-like lactoylglutathione lyase family enzyme